VSFVDEYLMNIWRMCRGGVGWIVMIETSLMSSLNFPSQFVPIQKNAIKLSWDGTARGGEENCGSL